MEIVKIVKVIMPFSSYLWIVIVGIAVWAWLWVNKQKGKQSLIVNRQWIETIPNVISTLGVFGTFLGISLGLLCFNTADLATSIPQLLEGLKTAFFTSLAGMIGSLFLTKKINNLYDEMTGGQSDINQAAGSICKAVFEFKEMASKQSVTQNNFYDSMQNIIKNLDANMTSINEAVSNISINAKKNAENQEEIKGSVNSIVTSVGNIEEVENAHKTIFEDTYNRLGDVLDQADAMVSIEGEVSEKITKLTDNLHGEVMSIEASMAEINTLLEKKFDEFSELLKKNNTEALVEVMKRVTEEFQKQMNELISKLVQENFAQLNKSVERLNQWQQENKEMISSLTAQYKQMAENFEDTSTTLTRVKDDTKIMVSEGGKLDQLVNSLNEVIVKDEKFKEISENLQKTADLSKSNMESFDASTQKLNDWVRKQRNFADAVVVLIQKLDELNQIRNYASEFWKETKTGMNDVVTIVRSASVTLNQQLNVLDQQFYARLSTTLAQLDSCIQALVTKSMK